MGNSGGRDPMWIDDDTVTQCMNCKTTFTLTNRRHHCRKCGKIFCGDCSKWTDAAGQRVCEADSKPPGPKTGGNQPKTGLYSVRVLHDFQEAEPGDLSIYTGEVLTVLDDQEDPFWWKGRNAAGKVGTFPSNYVEILK